MKEKVIAKGYIRKNPVEEAEEMYNEKVSKNTQTFCEVKQHEAIQYLKERQRSV